MSDVSLLRDDEKICKSCSGIIKKAAEICPKCGVRQKSASLYSEKSRLIALLLCTFLGVLGIHRFYVGKITSGIIQIILGWATLFIWLLIDWVMILSGGFKDIDGKRLVNWMP